MKDPSHQSITMNESNLLFLFWLLLCKGLESKQDSNDKNNFVM